MENNQKRNLLNMAYYGMVALVVLFSVIFFIRVNQSTLPTLIQIIYYVWAVALIIAIIFDVYCTMKHNMKYYAGLILFVLALLCVIMAIVVFFNQGISFAVITEAEITYFINIILSFVPIKLGIFAYLFGQKIINFND